MSDPMQDIREAELEARVARMDGCPSFALGLIEHLLGRLDDAGRSNGIDDEINALAARVALEARKDFIAAPAPIVMQEEPARDRLMAPPRTAQLSAAPRGKIGDLA
jgi:hypothetical protein